VFVDGDFWHGRDWLALQERSQARANPDYWIAKIGRNVQRDRSQTRTLESRGWRVIRVWERDVLSDPELHVGEIQKLLPPGVSASSKNIPSYSHHEVKIS
jgi:DNA mismatch endonuclease (patch repair protein)